MQSHQGLHGIGNNNSTSHQAQFGRLRFAIFSESIPFTSLCVPSIPELCKLTDCPLGVPGFVPSGFCAALDAAAGCGPGNRQSAQKSP
jgi:hypothetical protein